jgi:hypothetical protein
MIGARMRSLPCGPPAHYRFDSWGASPFRQRNENKENVMDKERIAGSAKQVIGGIKEQPAR